MIFSIVISFFFAFFHLSFLLSFISPFFLYCCNSLFVSLSLINLILAIILRENFSARSKLNDVLIIISVVNPTCFGYWISLFLFYNKRQWFCKVSPNIWITTVHLIPAGFERQIKSTESRKMRASKIKLPCSISQKIRI